ncbi:asparagine synthase-related protein [Streptomyces stramineus]
MARRRGLRPEDSLLIEPDGRARAQRWWTPPEPALSLAEGAYGVRGALAAAVETCTADGGTVSSDLSGGMDSTSLCFLAARGTARLVTLRWQGLDPGNDDAIWAGRATAELPGIEHVVPEFSRSPLWFSGLTDLRMTTEEPGAWVRDGARFRALAELMKSRGSRLHMFGGGGDELFTAFAPHLHDYVRSDPLAAFARIHAAAGLPAVAAVAGAARPRGPPHVRPVAGRLGRSPHPATAGALTARPPWPGAPSCACRRGRPPTRSTPSRACSARPPARWSPSLRSAASTRRSPTSRAAGAAPGRWIR